MRYFLRNPNSNFYISLIVCGVAGFILIPQDANAGKVIDNPPLKVFIPNVKDDSESAKLMSFGAERLDYYPQEAEMTATGNVAIEDEQRIILADNLNYEQKTDALTASGNVVLLEPNGKVNFVDNVEIKDKTKLAVVKKIKTKLINNPEFTANEESIKSSEKASNESSDKPSFFANLFSNLSDTSHANANASTLAKLEPAAGGDSPIPQPTPTTDVKPEIGNVPLISLPTTDAAVPKIVKQDSTDSKTPPAPPSPTKSDTTTSAIVPSTVPIIPASSVDPTVKSAPTVSVDSTSLPKVTETNSEKTTTTKNQAEAPKKSDMIPDVTKLISEDSAKISIPDAVPAQTDPIVKATEEPKPRKFKSKKKPAIIQAEATSSDNISKKSDLSTETQQNIGTDENSLSTESRKLLDKVAPKAMSTPSKNAPSPIDVDHQHDMSAVSKTGEAPAVPIPNPTLGVKVESKEQKINIDYELEKAYDQINSGQSTTAIETYKTILDNSPNNTQALFGLATLYHRARQLDKARPLYSKLLAIDPNNRDGFNNFLVLLADEAPHEALAELEKLEAKNPGFSTIPAQIAIIYQKIGDLDKATDKMFRAVSLSPENLTYRYNLAVMMDKQKNYQEAEKLYKQLIEAADRGEKIPGNIENLQQRLTFISSNK